MFRGAGSCLSLAKSLERPLPVLYLDLVHGHGLFKRADTRLLRLILADDDAVNQGSGLAARFRLWRHNLPCRHLYVYR